MPYTLRIIRLASLLVALAIPLMVQANTFEHQLANGLRVIVKEDHRAPTAVQMVWYRAGSMDELNGTTGVAHLLEHMMFKGTPSTGEGEFSRLVAAAGGRDNAFTSKDYTAYFQQVPGAGDLPPGVDLWRDCLAAEVWLFNRSAMPVQPKPTSSWTRQLSRHEPPRPP